MSKWCGDENCLQCVDKEPDPYVHLPREDYAALRTENQRLKEALEQIAKWDKRAQSETAQSFAKAALQPKRGEP